MFSFNFWWGIIKKHPKEVLIIILVIVIILQRGCGGDSRDGDNDNKTDTVIVINYDTTYIPQIETTYFYRTEHLIDTVFLNDTIFIRNDIPFDTLQIIADYFSSHIYIDTIVIPKRGKIIITDSVTQNKIALRQISATKFIMQVKVIEKEKISRQFYAGMGIGGYTDKFGFAGKILYIDKKHNGYGISYNPIQQYIEFSMYWKLF